MILQSTRDDVSRGSEALCALAGGRYSLGRVMVQRQLELLFSVGGWRLTAEGEVMEMEMKRQ
jgi:hypothetical protein